MLLRLGRGVRLKGHRVLCLNDRGHRIQACGGGDDDGGSDQQDIAHGLPSLPIAVAGLTSGQFAWLRSSKSCWSAWEAAIAFGNPAGTVTT